MDERRDTRCSVRYIRSNSRDAIVLPRAFLASKHEAKSKVLKLTLCVGCVSAMGKKVDRTPEMNEYTAR